MGAAYILCTSPRSGSTLLCGMLRQTGIAGAPQSLFHGPEIGGWARTLGLSTDAPMSHVLRAAIEAGRGGTQVFGLRLQQQSSASFLGHMRARFPDTPTDLAALEAGFGALRFIHLRRTDKLGQAISYVRAQQGGLWHRHADGCEMERLSPPATPLFDAARIANQIDAFRAADAAWAAWFDAQSIAPLSLDYAALSAAPADALRRVLRHIGQDADAAEGVAPGTARLADATTEDWRARFEAHPLAKRGAGA